MFICPYCCREVPEMTARTVGCCGEMHCEELQETEEEVEYFLTHGETIDLTKEQTHGV